MSTLVFSLHRPGAEIGRNPDTGWVEVLAASCVEHLSPGKVPSLNVRSDLPLRPGVIYKAYTGIVSEFPLPFPMCLVRAAADAWRFGVEVKRLDYGDGSELIVYFTVLEQLKLNEVPLRFQVYHPCFDGAELVTQTGGSLATPGIKIALEPATARRLVERPANPAGTQGGANGKQMTDAEAQKRAADWLNTPDDRGRVVDGPVTEAPRQLTPERPANVAAMVAPKDMKSNLSRGVVTAPLKPSNDDTVTKKVEVQEEYTVLRPQAEKMAQPIAADPIASLTEI